MDILKGEKKVGNNSKSKLVLNTILTISFLVIIGSYLLRAPIHEKDVIIHISSNDSLSKISNVLESEKVVRNPILLKIFVLIISSDKKIQSGDYKFVKGEYLWNVAWQIGRGIHRIERIRITFKEGLTNLQMSDLLADKILNFQRDLFLTDPRSKQGYLFPDTYFFFPLATTDEILVEMTSNFKKRIASLDKELKSSNKSLSDTIIMASILEKEVGGEDDAPIISGILWKRLKLGMLLQVDADPSTYKNYGLPKSPISNPGFTSILSAIKPVDSPYLFYLHDSNGQVHYGVDFSQHRSNIAKYLK